MNSLLPELNIIENVPYATKLIHGQYKYPVTITKKADRFWFSFGFNKGIMEEIKSMEGHKWHGFETPPIKQWSVVDSVHNRFRILFLEGKNPYAFYDKPLIEATTRRPTYDHQVELFRHMITRLYCIVSSEMGTGKTLAVIEAIEWLCANSEMRSWFYIAPKSALTAVQLEFEKWRSLIQPRFYTYDALRELVKNWPAGMAPPNGIVYDESSRVKTPTSGRSEAAKHMAHAIRREHGTRGAVILMSGTPAPKSPLDWFNQCAIACPGFLREGTYEKFRRRLAVMAEGQNDAGQVFSKLVTWKDDSTKCDTCGKPKEDFVHDPMNMLEKDYHEFKPAVNEVQNLYKRMKGLVIVKFKKDCFSGSTLVLTRQGPAKIADLAKIGHAELYVLTDSGMQWIDCPVRSFGTGQTFELMFGDRSKIRTTMHHEWLWISKGKLQPRKLFTHELKEGKTELPLAQIALNPPDDEGYAHGFVYGDGSSQNQNHTKVELFGHDCDLKPLLFKYGTLSYVKRKGWDSYNDVIASLPKHWKELPVTCTREYALGFVLGLVAADGCSDGHLRIYQADDLQLEKIRTLAIYAGLRISPMYLARWLSPFDGSVKPLWYFSIQTYNIKPEWILRKDHRKKFEVRGRKTATTVTNIDWQSGQQEETFCAVVPQWHNFTLANGVITGNCLSLPDKQYRVIQCTPTPSIINAARIITARNESVIKTMTLLRELSDGFQYESQEIGIQVCPLCDGKRTRLDWKFVGPDDLYEEMVDLREAGQEIPSEYFEQVEMACSHCNGIGEVAKYAREAVQVPCPKEDALREIIDEHDDVGRLVTYAGFTGSIERVVNTYLKARWDVIRVDGRGWWSNVPGKAKDLIKRFQYEQEAYPRLAFVGQPGAAGMGLTLTASPTIVYYSNDFNGESRSQSEDRIHRPGMDLNRGATIIDLIHLPTDQVVLDNLKRKRKLELITMGEFKAALN